MVIRSQNEVRRMKNEERAAGYDDQSFMLCGDFSKDFACFR